MSREHAERDGHAREIATGKRGKHSIGLVCLRGNNDIYGAGGFSFHYCG